MKKSILFLASAALLLAGCAKVADENKEVVPENKERVVILKASVEESDTRVSADVYGKYSWQYYDAVSVLLSDGSYVFGYVEEENPGAEAEITVTLEGDAEIGKYAYYPSSRRGEIESNYFLLENELHYYPEETFMPMLGTITSQEAIFRSVGGVLEVPILHFPSDGCLLQVSVNGKRVTGAFLIEEVNGMKQINAVDIDYEDSICILYDGSLSGQDIDNPDGPDGDEGYEGGEGEDITWFYIPLPCGTYSEMTFSIYDSFEPTESALIFSKTARINGLEVARNDIITTPVLEVTIEPNYPASIVLSDVPYGYSLDDNGVLHLDQFDTPIDMVAFIYGKNESKPVEEVDEELISCTLVNVTDPDNVVEYDIDFDYDVYSGVTMAFPTDVDGEFKLKVYYDKDGDNPLTAESSTFKVYKAAPLPEALKIWKEENEDFWFSKYRVVDDDGNAYLKTYAAGTLYGTSYLYPVIPNNAGWEGPFNGAFNNSDTPGSFDAFQFFEKLTKVTNYAFSNCPYLTGITLPDAVTEIGKAAFFDCKKLTSVTLPSNLVTIGVEAFKDCKQLGQIVLPNTVTKISSEAFYGCLSLSSINIPESVTTIGEWAFGSCALNHVIIPTSVSTIGDKAFGNCSLLEYAVFEGTTPPTISEGIDPVFEDGVTIYVPDGSESAYGAVFGNCTILPISQKPAGN